MVFGFTFAFLGTELIDSYIYFPLMFTIVCLLFANIVLLQYSFGRTLSFWLTLGALSFAYIYDFVNHSRPKQKRVFFIPMFVEGLVLLLGFCLYYYQIPERWCKETKFVQLYLTGFVFYTLLLMNCIFEAHNIIYYSIRLNTGVYDDYDDNWWRMDNIFHK